jgi:hypothetical protein
MISFHVLCKSLSGMVYSKIKLAKHQGLKYTSHCFSLVLFIYFKYEWHVLDNEVSKLGLFWSAVQDNEDINSNVL